ncbi:MAG: VOC family protein [Rhodocyclaceae bacterium]|nr:VOC family protein [Rhodocyclaceae bacterium]
MKRFHVHLHVADLPASIAFYSRLFDAEPVRVEADYAKWMVDDPRLNFAISTRGAAPGIDHLGIQTDDAAELPALKARALASGGSIEDEGQTTCCYAQSEKHWVTDPQGIAWEHFHTLADIPVFRVAAASGEQASCCAPAPAEAAAAAAPDACCTPRGRGKPLGIAVKSAGSCC